MDKIKEKEWTGPELMATFAGAWVKYGLMLGFVAFSCIAHLLNRAGEIKEKLNERNTPS